MGEATMKSVAEHAGVSIATVSRAISDTAPVSKETKEKIFRVMRELNYVPRDERMAPGTRTADTIALVLALATKTLHSDVFFLRIIEGINQELESSNIRLNVTTLSQQDLAEGKSAALAEVRMADGLIIGGAIGQGEDLVQALDFTAPVVVFDRYHQANVSSVIVDNVEAGRIVVRHLGALGHSRIGVVAGPEDIPAVNDKLDGYVLGLNALGQVYDDALVARSEHFHSWEAGYAGGRRLLSLAAPPTAIMATDDLMAYGVMRAAQEKGVRIPDDLALVGYGDILYDQMGIALTSVAVNFQYFGRLTVRLLLDIIAGHVHRQTQLSVWPTLVIRETCGADRKSACEQA